MKQEKWVKAQKEKLKFERIGRVSNYESCKVLLNKVRQLDNIEVARIWQTRTFNRYYVVAKFKEEVNLHVI